MQNTAGHLVDAIAEMPEFREQDDDEQADGVLHLLEGKQQLQQPNFEGFSYRKVTEWGKESSV